MTEKRFGKQQLTRKEIIQECVRRGIVKLDPVDLLHKITQAEVESIPKEDRHFIDDHYHGVWAPIHDPASYNLKGHYIRKWKGE